MGDGVPLTPGERSDEMNIDSMPLQGIGHRFRLLERTDDMVRLQDVVDSRVVEAERRLVLMTIRARVRRICRSLTSDKLEAWVTLEVTDLILGNEDDYSDLSRPLGEYAAENGIFGLDDEGLSELLIDSASVVDLRARDWLAVPFVTGPGALESSIRASDTHEEPVAELWHHSREDDTGVRSSALVLSVGLPPRQLGELIEACSDGRADTLVLECSCHAYTTRWPFHSARDLILSTGEAVRLAVAEATMSGFVPASTGQTYEPSHTSQRETPEPKPDPPEVARVSPDSNRVGANLMIATVLVSLFLGLLGVNPVAVLTIAVLGGFAGLIATLTSILGALAARQAR